VFKGGRFSASEFGPQVEVELSRSESTVMISRRLERDLGRNIWR
jgi:hypothetical protein